MRASVLFLFLSWTLLEGAYVQAPSPLETLRHHVSNQEIEIRTFERKLENLQVILEGLQEEVQAKAAVSKSQIKDNFFALEIKINALDSAMKGLHTDLQQLRSHANETTGTLQTFKKTLMDHEQALKSQNENMDQLTLALNSLVEAIQPKETSKEQILYKIQCGDTLEKIAKANGMSVKELKRINHLNNSDKIVIGKTLKLTE